MTAEKYRYCQRERGKKSCPGNRCGHYRYLGTMCSSGAFLNFGHSKPRIKMNKANLNGVPAYAGIAAVDAYIGATALPKAIREQDSLGQVLYGEDMS